MRQKIDDILVSLMLGKRNITWAGDELLRLFNVSGNEASPSTNKKDGEVAVCPSCGGEYYYDNAITWWRCKKCLEQKKGQTDC